MSTTAAMAPRFSVMSGPCKICFKAAKWLPVLFIVTVVVWSYYAYVIQLNLLTVDSIIEKCFYLLVYHILLVLFLWAYWQTIFTDIGRVPKQFRLPPTELDRYESAETDEARRAVLEGFMQKQNLPVYNRTMTGDIRYCEKCVQIKPDRCHHCSVCGECVLKLDHHCPWVNNCVAFTNYKFFILFLGYALIYCLFVTATTLQYFILFWKNQLEVSGKFHILFVFFVSIMFAISLVSLFGYHIFLVLKNRSTLESFRAPLFQLRNTWVQDKDGFSLGTFNNFVEVFGDNRKLWFLPLASRSSHDKGKKKRDECSAQGSDPRHPYVSLDHFGSPHSSCTEPNTEDLNSVQFPSAAGTPELGNFKSCEKSSILGDGVTYPQRCVDEDTDDLLGSRQRWAEDEDNELTAGYVNNHSHALEEVGVQANHTNPV